MTTDNLKLAQLGITSGEFWFSKYPNFTTTFTTQLEYLDFHKNFRTLVLTQIDNTNERSKVTKNLEDVNKKITSSIKLLKAYLSETYEDNSKSYYAVYGLVFENKKHTIAKDNDKRMLALDALINTLQSPNNPISTQKYGLSHWSDLRDEHRTVWTKAKTLDGTCSINSANLKKMKAQAIVLQKNLRAQIRIIFSDNYKSILRDFGFQ